jgi:hypothetical protein
MKQTRKVGVAGGFFNQMMGNNETIPKVGEGATELMYSDRHAWEVIKTNEDGSECTIQRYKSKRIDNLGMSDSQSYEYTELSEEKRNLVWRKKKGGCWCEHSKEVRLIPSFKKHLEANSTKFWFGDMVEEVYGKEMKEALYDSEGRMVVLENVSKQYDNYHPISIIFGVKREYYDFSF